MVLVDPSAVRRVVVFRALPGLGDMLCIVPALRALRRALPGAHIVLVALEHSRWVVERYPYCDELVPFPGWPGLPEVEPDLEAIPSFVAGLQARRFDVAVQAHGSGVVTNPVVALIGARLTAGFHHPGQPAPDADGFLAWDGHEPEVLRYLRLLEHLGVPAADPALEFPIRQEEEQAAAVLAPAGGAPYAVVHPGTNQPSRRWPPERFATVAARLAEAGLPVVVTGSAGERALADQVVAAVPYGAGRAVAGETALGVMAALVAGARVMVSADTGVAHLAAAVGTPSVVVFRSSDAGRWAPLDRHRHRVLGLGEPVARMYLERPGDGRCLGDGCRRLHADAADVPVSGVPADEVAREAIDLAVR